MDHIRGLIYRVGIRPKYGSIWFSPTRHILYTFEDEAFIQWIAKLKEKHTNER